MAFFHRKHGSERDAAFYDDLFRSGGHRGQYHVPYTESRYLPVWRRAAGLITARRSTRVLDIGCGPGQFARLLSEAGLSRYTGIDHSAVAIEMARQAVPEWAGSFEVADAFTVLGRSAPYDMVVLFEVLEHIERDRELLAGIPPGTRVLFSVPSYLSASHVRRFRTAWGVRRRYGAVVDDLAVERFRDCPEPGKTIYLGSGVISEKARKRFKN